MERRQPALALGVSRSRREPFGSLSLLERRARSSLGAANGQGTGDGQQTATTGNATGTAVKASDELAEWKALIHNRAPAAPSEAATSVATSSAVASSTTDAVAHAHASAPLDDAASPEVVRRRTAAAAAATQARTTQVRRATPRRVDAALAGNKVAGFSRQSSLSMRSHAFEFTFVAFGFAVCLAFVFVLQQGVRYGWITLGDEHHAAHYRIT